MLFIAYWAVTFLYVSPNNFLKAKAYNSLSTFGILFQQKWEFFAPPPKSNNRLYYTFFDNQQKTIATYEVVKPILKEKQQKKPWNTREEALDYIVNGAIINLMDMTLSQKDIYQHIYPDSTDTSMDRKAKLAISERYNTLPSYKTLVEYGKIVAAKNFTPPQYDGVEAFKISITDIRLPKFKDRANLMNGTVQEEALVLETPFIPFRKETNSLSLDSSN